jgi:phage terminase large subunit
VKVRISESFVPSLESQSRYLIECGGAGSGKTEFAARKVFYRCQVEGGHRFLILRKVRSRVRESVMEVMARVLAENNIKYEDRKTERAFSWVAPNGTTNELLFDGLDDPEKIKSIKGITSIWLEEATEFSKEDFLQIDLRLLNLSQLVKVQHYIDKLIQERTARIEEPKYLSANVSAIEPF